MVEDHAGGGGWVAGGGGGGLGAGFLCRLHPVSSKQFRWKQIVAFFHVLGTQLGEGFVVCVEWTAVVCPTKEGHHIHLKRRRKGKGKEKERKKENGKEEKKNNNGLVCCKICLHVLENDRNASR